MAEKPSSTPTTTAAPTPAVQPALAARDMMMQLARRSGFENAVICRQTAATKAAVTASFRASANLPAPTNQDDILTVRCQLQAPGPADEDIAGMTPRVRLHFYRGGEQPPLPYPIWTAQKQLSAVGNA